MPRTFLSAHPRSALPPRSSETPPALPPGRLTRVRRVLGFAMICWSAWCFAAAAEPGYRLASFAADITVPPGHGMMGGSWLSRSIADPLEAIGLVLLGGERPVVVVALDWCEVRNDALDRWRSVLASAAGTESDHVMVCTLHQHDAPVADLEAERILRAARAAGTVCDPEFHEQAVQRTARALRDALPQARRIDRIGTGTARVDRIASNRRYTMPDGSVRFDRTSATRNAFAIAGGEGLVDPWLRTLSFWDGDQPVAAISAYAVHPMSHYGAGAVSADFPGIARRERQAATPGVRQLYVTGCAGNVTAGKYNDGQPTNRVVLARRLADAMAQAWTNTRTQPLSHAAFRVARVRLDPREGPGWSVADLRHKIATDSRPFQQCLAALALSWRKRTDAGHRVELPLLDLGAAQFLILPGEAYVEYQLAAQDLRPGSFVVTAGYGEGATGYIPTEQHIRDRDPNLGDWWWVAPGSEPRLLDALRQLLNPAAR